LEQIRIFKVKKFFLENKRFIVRNFNHKDINKEYLSWFNGKNENLKFSRHYKKKYNRRILVDNLKNFLNSKDFFLGIFDIKTEELIGTITVYIDNKKSGNLGIFIGNKKFFSKGYALESCQIVIKFLFKEKLVNSIVAGTKNENIKMINLMKNLNMKKMIRKDTLNTSYTISKLA